MKVVDNYVYKKLKINWIKEKLSKVMEVLIEESHCCAVILTWNSILLKIENELEKVFKRRL